MKVPFHLRRTGDPRPTRALLIPGRDAGVVLDVCARIGVDRVHVHAVADGFLLVVDRGLDTPVAGAIRLGELAANLLVPIDAELVPALLPDEGAALGRRRGLIFLPGERVLEFHPDEPILLSALVEFPTIRRGGWRSLPEPPALATRLEEITYHRPGDVPDVIIESGGDGISKEAPRPDDASLPRKILGNLVMEFGEAVRLVGKSTGLSGVAKLGGMLMAAGLSLAPRLSEKIMGQQEASLRDLLEDFRKGDIEKALRRALPLGGPGSRGSSPHQGSQLPTNNVGYSLGNILGGWGPASLWYTPDQLYHELQREYRKQAEAAVHRGDYRRAAFIYGKLLSDFVMAADVLAQGGFHHDAAIIYLKRLQDYLSAAREFEAAGEVDEALQLYRQCGEHVRAGDLLRRMGEIDAAVAEYVEAAEELIAKNQSYSQAGTLMLEKAERPDLAKQYFLAGWNAWPNGQAVACGRSLAQMYAQSAECPSLLRLVEEAEENFQLPGNETLAAEFFNEVARLAERPALAVIRETLRDRSLMSLALKLRQGWDNVGPLAARLFGPDTVWDAPLVEDAHFAAKRARSSAVPWITNARISTVAIQGRVPIVSSVGHAAETDEIFLGYESGEIACFHPRRGDVHFLDSQPGPVRGLAVDASATSLVSLSQVADDGTQRLASFTRTGTWRTVQVQDVAGPGPYWISPMLARTRDLIACLYDGANRELRFLRLPRLLPEGAIALEDCHPLTGLPLILRDGRPPSILESFAHGSILGATLLLFDGREMWHVSSTLGAKNRTHRTLCGFPGRQSDSSLEITPVSWLVTGPLRIEVAGIGPGGVLRWFDIEFLADRIVNTVSRFSPGPFRAATLVRNGVIAAITEDAIVWLRVSENGIQEHLRQRLALSDVIACYPSRETQELVLVTGNGTVARLRQAV